VIEVPSKLTPRARQIYNALPESLKWMARKLRNAISYVPLTRANARRRFLRNVYMSHIRDEHRYIFASIARFCTTNRPIDGYYFEFGCHTAGTMRMAYDYFRYLFDWTYVAFDSFEGLPEISDIDRQEIWQRGKLATGEDEFVRRVIQNGMPREKLITVKGFYDKSLSNELKQRLLPVKAAVVYIDCDLYASTVPVLEFVKDFFQVGTVLVFDDWNCFCGDPNRGERRAFREFCERYPEFHFEDFISTHMQKAFIYTGSVPSVAVRTTNAATPGGSR